MNAQTVVVNELGQTTQLGERQFNYDPTGHLRTLTANEGTTEYRYFPNQLRSQKIQGDQITYYDYDLQGQLISERVSHGGAAPVTTREYLWLGHELVGYYTDGQLCFVHNDHLTTPQALSDSQQNKVWSLEKKAFGESTFTDQPITFNIRFPGQYYDQESGLHYNWHRYYDPQLGRYLQSDPIGLNGGLSTFGYVYQNPMSFVDPDGLMARPPPVTPRPPVSAQRPPVPKQRRGESLQEYSKRLQDYARNRNENSRPELKEKPHDATRNGKYDPNSTGPGRKQRFMDKVKDFFESFPSDGFSAPPVAPGDGCNASAIDDCLKSGWCA